MPAKKSVFETLSAIDVSDHLDKKGKLDYLSWSWAWSIVKSHFPKANWEIGEYPEFRFNQNSGEWYATGQQLDYRLNEMGCEVKTSVTIEGETYKMRLYVMDNYNRVIKKPDLAQINKAQLRCLVKTLAIAGLGLNVYAGEDLPMGDINQQDQQRQTAKQEAQKQQSQMATYHKLYDHDVAEIVKLTGQNADAVNQAIGNSLGQKDEFKTADRLDQWRQLSEFAQNMLQDTKNNHQQEAS